MVSAAPTSWAAVAFSSESAIAIARAPAAFATWIAISPTPPTPFTTTVSPSAMPASREAWTTTSRCRRGAPRSRRRRSRGGARGSRPAHAHVRRIRPAARSRAGRRDRCRGIPGSADLRAAPAAHHVVDGHAVTRRHSAARRRFEDDARRLVAELKRRRRRRDHIEEVELGSAHAGGPGRHERPSVGRRIGGLLDSGLFVGEQRGFHAASARSGHCSSR